jgi:predicted DCC family thiol-disulfide oxidoreductase YuxK
MAERPVLIYDGDCAFCQRSVALARRVHPGLRSQAYQQTDLAALGVAEARAEHEVLWADAAGRVSGGAQAVARLLIDAGQPWAAAGWLLRVPPLSWLAAVVYRLIATHRHQLPGGTAACAVDARPAPDAASGPAAAHEAGPR